MTRNTDSEDEECVHVVFPPPSVTCEDVDSDSDSSTVARAFEQLQRRLSHESSSSSNDNAFEQLRQRLLSKSESDDGGWLSPSVSSASSTSSSESMSGDTTAAAMLLLQGIQSISVNNQQGLARRPLAMTFKLRENGVGDDGNARGPLSMSLRVEESADEESEMDCCCCCCRPLCTGDAWYVLQSALEQTMVPLVLCLFCWLVIGTVVLPHPIEMFASVGVLARAVVGGYLAKAAYYGILQPALVLA